MALARRRTARKSARKPARKSAHKRPVRREKDARLSKEVICAAALALIDEKGLDDFSLRDVARSLGVYPRAIYWYVDGRSELLSEVVGFALRDVYPPAANGDWKDWLRKLFQQYRQAVRQHPNIAPLIGASMLTPATMVPITIERILGVLGAAGFPEKHLVDVYNVIIAAQVGFVTLEFAMVPAGNTKWGAEQKRRMSTVDVLRYPLLGRHLPEFANRAFVLRWENGTKAPLDSSFNRFVEAVIDGLDHFLTQSKTSN